MEKLYRRTNSMYLPALFLFAVFVVYPFFDGIRISFTNWNGFSQKYSYIGFKNFQRLLIDENVRIAFLIRFYTDSQVHFFSKFWDYPMHYSLI